jgi:hypothetical protein
MLENCADFPVRANGTEFSDGRLIFAPARSDCKNRLFGHRIETRSRNAPLSRNDYFYVLHRNADGHETTARKYLNREVALIALAAEAGESLNFIAHDVRSSSHTLKRFANMAGRPGELLENFLVTTEEWVATDRRHRKVAVVIERRRKKP